MAQNLTSIKWLFYFFYFAISWIPKINLHQLQCSTKIYTKFNITLNTYIHASPISIITLIILSQLQPRSCECANNNYNNTIILLNNLPLWNYWQHMSIHLKFLSPFINNNKGHSKTPLDSTYDILRQSLVHTKINT